MPVHDIFYPAGNSPLTEKVSGQMAMMNGNAFVAQQFLVNLECVMYDGYDPEIFPVILGQFHVVDIVQHLPNMQQDQTFGMTRTWLSPEKPARHSGAGANRFPVDFPVEEDG
ncbi:MAG: hypothetical protein IPJ06_17285 [Saprospiraceae bacterium]|nr:hypothetical protein [Saprospiraceae bacterium]